MASIHKREGARGPTYKVMFRDQVGRQVGKSFKRLEDARRFKASVEHDRPEDVTEGRVTLAQVLDEMRASTKWSTATLRQQDVYVRALLRSDPKLFEVEVGKLTSARLNAAIGKVDKPHVQKRCRVLVNQLLKHAGRPVLRVARDKTRAAKMERRADARERTLETAEVAALLEAMPERYRTMVTIMAYLGLRPGESYGLQLGDYDPVARTLTIRRAVSLGKVGPTKTGETRTIPVGGLGDLIEGHAKEYGVTEADAYLFTNPQGNVLHESTFRGIFAQALKDAGIPNNATPNSLRHHAVAWMIHRGANVLQVSKMLGHAKPSITMDVYAYLFNDSLGEIGAMLPTQLPLRSSGFGELPPK